MLVEKTTKAVKKSAKVTASMKEAQEILNKHVYVDRMLKVLDTGFNSETNVILSGKGGHSKSVVSLNYFRAKGIEPFIYTMGSGTTEDVLMGGLNMRTFEGLDDPKTKGKIEYLVENSWMNHEYVIFEEMLDAPAYILERLKDIISSGIFRNGSQVFEIKTKFIICCTNHQRADFAKNTSLKALMERFPLELEVKWKDYTEANYRHLFDTVRGNSIPLLVYILGRFAKKQVEISPRIALKADELLRREAKVEDQVECLHFLADFNANSDILKTAISDFKSIAQMQKKVKKVKELNEDLRKLDLNSLDLSKTTNEEKFRHTLDDYRKAILSLNKLKVSEDDVTTKAHIVTEHKNALEGYTELFEDLLTVAGGTNPFE